jgi:hypothetical protein
MLLAGAVVLVLVPSQQQAIAKGVFFDPSSPAGKEYALPLDQARNEASGTESDSPTGEKAHLFGEGISGQGPGPGTSGGGEATGRTGTSGTGNAAQGQSGGSRHPGKTAVVAAAISSPHDRYALSSAILWIAAFVALGGIAALVLRVAQRPRPI